MVAGQTVSSIVLPAPRIGVGVILWKQSFVLLGRRHGDYGDACWQFPGGRLESHESVLQCAARELLEETGLQTPHMQTAAYTSKPFRTDSGSFITLYVSARWHRGEPRVMEAEKCSHWQWFDYRELPEPLFEPVTLLLEQCGDLRAACPGGDIPAGGHR